MSTRYETFGRTQQKARTRSALVTAARELLAEGLDPTVERVADRAAISRTTAYRYFPNQRALLAATYPMLEVSSLLGESPPSDPVTRLDIVTELLCRHLLDYEPELRTQLRLSLEAGERDGDDLVLRKGRAVPWIGEALTPLRDRLGKQELRRLVLAIRATVGIEPLVWLVDVAGVSRDGAVDIMRSSARTLLIAAMQEAAAE
ncbi:MAG: TetR/AcrR family transcriptional regulator [Actinomycetota bacterium]